jgi:Ca2+-binding RTX toxin-like protein
MATINLFDNPNASATAEDDTIYGSSGNDTIYGLDGNDIIVTLFVEGGNDTIYGGNGNDEIISGPGNDYLDGGDGDDFLTPGAGLNRIVGGAGFDRLEYQGETRNISTRWLGNGVSEVYLDGVLSDRFSGIESMILGSGNDTVTADDAIEHTFHIIGGGNDTLIGGNRTDNFTCYDFIGTISINGNGGYDGIDLSLQSYFYPALKKTIQIDLTSNTISVDNLFYGVFINIEGFNTSSNNDTIVNDKDLNLNSFSTGDGDDVFFAGLGKNYYDGGSDTDTLDLSQSTKAAANQKITFRKVTDDLYIKTDGECFFSNVEKLNGTNFNDKITLSGGTLLIDGGLGQDTLIGGSFNDTFYGGADNDTLNGGAGNDRLIGDSGNDTLIGGAGNDTMYGEDGDDSITTTSGQDWVYGGNGNDKLTGSKDDDHLEGDAGNDTIVGAAGNDALWGSAGNDIIDGGAGIDYIWGGNGNDKLTGGLGVDRFHFGQNETLDSANLDTITDFKNDDIYLYANTFVNRTFVAVNALSEANLGEGLIYEKSTGTLYYDNDGAGTGALAIAFVLLTGKPTLTLTNFTFELGAAVG